MRAKISPLPQRRKVPSLSDTRLWLGGLAALALLIAALIVKDTVFPSRATAAGLRLSSVTRGTVASTVTGTGTLTPNMQINVGFKTAGQLTEVDVKVGDHVKTGQLLAKVDSSTQQTALAQAQAQLAVAYANLQQAQSPATPAQVAQLQHAVASAQQNYNDTVAQVNIQNQADANTVSNDRNQLSSDQSKYNSDGCNLNPQPNPSACSQDQSNITKDENQLSNDQYRQRSDQISGQSRIDSASQQITSAKDNLTLQTQAKPSSVASAQANVTQAQAQVQSAQLALNQTTLTAPTSGVIVSINGEVGEFVGSSGGTTAQAPGVSAPLSLGGSSSSSASGASSGSSGGFMVISDTSQYYAVVPFAEADASSLQADQPASITFDAIPGLTISGHLVSVAPNATVSSSVVNYYASFVLNHSDPRLRSGLTANAAVTVAQADNVLYVPNSAIRQQNGTSMVTVYSNGEQIPTEVETGIVGDSVTEIKGGLTEGQQVVLPTVRLSSGTGTGGTGGGGLFGRGGLGGGGGFRGGG